jgi:hypothetical protein
MPERKNVKYKFNLTAVALGNKVARIVLVLMTRDAGTTVGRSRHEQRGSSIGSFRRQGRSASRAPTK